MTAKVILNSTLVHCICTHTFHCTTAISITAYTLYAHAYFIYGDNWSSLYNVPYFSSNYKYNRGNDRLSRRKILAELWKKSCGPLRLLVSNRVKLTVPVTDINYIDAFVGFSTCFRTICWQKLQEEKKKRYLESNFDPHSNSLYSINSLPHALNHYTP